MIRTEPDDEAIWVFVSHANADFERVRLLRNRMEELGLRPLLFYLKCLEGAGREEVFELIKREIDVRPRFFLCQSQNARRSEWVDEEVKYIKSKNRPYITVDLDDPASFDSKIGEMRRRAQVFVSYARADRHAAEAIVRELRRREFRVFDHTAMNPSAPFASQLQSQIRSACDNGYFVPLVSEHYVRSRFATTELEYAFSCGGRLLPAVLQSRGSDPTAGNPALRYLLGSVAHCRFDAARPEASASEFADWLQAADRERNA